MGGAGQQDLHRRCHPGLGQVPAGPLPEPPELPCNDGQRSVSRGARPSLRGPRAHHPLADAGLTTRIALAELCGDVAGLVNVADGSTPGLSAPDCLSQSLPFALTRRSADVAYTRSRPSAAVRDSLLLAAVFASW